MGIAFLRQCERRACRSSCTAWRAWAVLDAGARVPARRDESARRGPEGALDSCAQRAPAWTRTQRQIDAAVEAAKGFRGVGLGHGRRRHALLRRLLERVRELDQPRLAARRAGEAHAERRRLRVEARPETPASAHSAPARTARSRSDSPACAAMPAPLAAGKQHRVEPLRLHHLVDAVRRRRAACPSRGRPRSARDPPRGPSRRRCRGCDWPYLIAPAFGARCSTRAARSASSPAPTARATRSQTLKSRFIPYLKTTEQSSSLPFACSAPEQKSHSRKLFFGSLSTTLGMSAGSTMIAPCCFSTAIASAIAFACSAFRPPRGSVVARRRRSRS